MNASNDNHLDLERQLDEAGRLCRPRHPGWDTLLDRLPPREPAAARRPPKTDSRRARFRWRTLAIAATILAAVGLGFFLFRGPTDIV
ncbi:MAG: hypothetical protein ACYSWU_12085, partial [Planctomycetota bacterium]